MTFRLGAASRARLVGVDPQLVACVELAIEVTDQDFAVTDGLRTVERQRELVRRGASKTMNSMHLAQADGFSHAVDLVPFEDGPRWEWPLIYPVALAMHQAAVLMGLKLTWGGVWDRSLTDLPASVGGLKAAVQAYAARHPGPDFLDGPHFQLRR